MSQQQTPSEILAYLQHTTKNIAKLKKKASDADLKVLLDIAYSTLSAVSTKYENVMSSDDNSPRVVVQEDDDGDGDDIKVVPSDKDDGGNDTDKEKVAAFQWKLKLLATNAASRDVTGPSRASRTLPTPPPAPVRPPSPQPAPPQVPPQGPPLGPPQSPNDANIEEFFEYLVTLVRSLRQNPDPQGFSNFRKAYQLKPRMCFIRRYNHWSKKKTGGANDNILDLNYNEINDGTVLELFNQICNMPLA